MKKKHSKEQIYELIDDILKSIKIDNEELTNDYLKIICLDNKKFFLILELLHYYSLVEDLEKIENYENLIHFIFEDKIFLKTIYFSNDDFEELIDYFITFYFNYLLVNKKFRNIEKNFYFIFNFLENLHNFNELIIEKKQTYILETWNYFNSINLNEHYNINLYYVYTKKLFSILGLFNYFKTNIDNDIEKILNNNIISENFYNDLKNNFDDNSIFLIVKTLHNLSNAFIELNKKDLNNIIYFNLYLSYFLIKENNYKNNFLFFFIISNTNYINFFNKFDDEKITKFLTESLKNFTKDEGNKEEYLKLMKKIKKMVLNKKLLNIFNLN